MYVLILYIILIINLSFMTYLLCGKYPSLQVLGIFIILTPHNHHTFSGPGQMTCLYQCNHRCKKEQMDNITSYTRIIPHNPILNYPWKNQGQNSTSACYTVKGIIVCPQFITGFPFSQGKQASISFPCHLVARHYKRAFCVLLPQDICSSIHSRFRCNLH